MSVSTAYVLHGLTNSSTVISQIQNARATTEIANIISESSGLPFPIFTGPMSVNPGVAVETLQVKTILDSTGALSSIVDLSGANTDLYFKKISDLGRRVADATTEHIRFRMAQAWMALNQITAGHNSEAVASVYVGTTYDGSNLPLVPAGSVALSGTPTSAEHYVAGPVVLNTVAVPGVQDITIDFGRRLYQLGGDGELYNTFAACQFYSPVITFRCLTHAWATYGINGTALTALTAYLRQVTSTGRTANATETHIAFTATAGTIQVDEATGGGNEPSMVTVRCTLVGANATTEPIAVDTTAAIA